MSDYERYEYVIKPKKDKKNKLLRFSLVMLYILFVLGWFGFGIWSRIFLPLLALIPLSLWFLVFATWRYANVEYEYAVEMGVITFTKIYGGKSRKRILIFDIRDAEVFLPLGDSATRRALDDFDPKTEFSFAASEDAEGSFLALCTDEDDARIAISFTADDRLLRLLKIYNAKAMTKDQINH